MSRPILPDEIRVAILQWNISPENPQENLAVCERLLRQAALSRPHLILLPEMWTRSFCGPNLRVEAKAARDRLDFCREQAKSLGAWIAAGTIPESGAGEKVYNTLHLIDPEGELRLSYRKRHLFPLTGEPEFFLAGESNPVLCEAGPWRIGAGICFDLRFPELFRLQAKQGANLFLLPAQFPNPRQDTFRALSRARSIENQACLVCVNRTGKEGSLSFFGGSMLIDHAGTILTEMAGEEGVAVGTFRASDLEKSRKDFPFLDLTPTLDEMLPPSRDGGK